MKIAIIDDDKTNQERLFHALPDDYDITILYPHELKDRSYMDYDLYFLDIEMEPSGIYIAQKISKYNRQAIIIFVTNHEQYIFETQILNPFYFIRKKHLQHDLDICLSLLQEHINSYINISFKNDYYMIPLNHIQYVEIFKGKITIVTTKESIQYWGTLKELESKLPNNQFYKIHRSYIINKNYISQIKDHTIIINNQALPIAKNRYKDICHKLKGDSLL